MKLLRNIAAATTVLALSATLAACSEEDDAAASDNDGTSTQSEDAGDAAGSDDMGGDTGGTEPAAATFGPGCSELPTSGAGSLDGMVDDPVATAAGNNPLLSTLVTAVGAINGLADTLNSQEALTVFAPYDPAFGEIPKKDLDGLVKDGQKQGQDSALFQVLAHHVLPTNAGPDAVGGEQETLAGDALTVEGDPEAGMTVTDGTVTASVLCGGIPTANATVYVIDKVLTGVK